MMNWFFTIFNIHLHFESAIFHPLIDWLSEWVNGLCDIEEYDIPSKYRIVKPRLILLLTTTIKYQTHPIWFHYYQIDKSMFCDSLINKQTNKQTNDSWIDWMVNPIWFPMLFNRILFYSILFYSMYTVIDSYSISQNQYPNSISIILLYSIVLYYLPI